MKILYKNEKGLYQLTIFGYNKYIAQSVYNKATIIYPIERIIYQTEIEIKVDKVVDADGKEIILKTYEIETPIFNEDGNKIIKEKVRDMVKYNPYDEEYIIIPDDAIIITKEEYDEILSEKEKQFSLSSKK